MSSPTPSAQFPSTVSISVENVTLPGRELPTAVLQLDSTLSNGLILWSSAALADLKEALTGIEQSAVEAVVVIGNRRSFGAGANLDEIRHAQNNGDGQAFITAGHEVFGLLAEASVPTIAVITGQALGGGLELALHADHRVGHRGGAVLGLPECRLGFFPGWGGVYLLPHLIGPQAAIDMITFDALKGRYVRPAKAQEIGLLDTLLEVAPGQEGWTEAWQSAVVELLNREAEGKQHGAGESAADTAPGSDANSGLDAEHAQQWQAAVDAARSKAQKVWRGAAPAPLAALDLIEAAATQSRVENGQAAIDCFGDLVTGDIARASLRTFQLVDSRSRKTPDRPDVAGRQIKKVAVVGAGLMARQLAALFARSLQVPVVLTDIDAQRLAEGVQWVADKFQQEVDRGRLKPEQARALTELVTGAQQDSDLADVDFLIEATPEEMKIKKAVLSHWATIVGPDAVLATNTSSLSVTEMAQAVENPGRFVGFHVFNPVDATPLLEIITTEQTSEEALATAFDLAKAMKRTAVRVSDAPGFVVNRLLLRMFDPVLVALDAGMDPKAADHALDPLGLPMTPLQLLDFVGPAVLHHVGERMHQAYPERFHVSPWMEAVVKEGETHVLPQRGTPATAGGTYLTEAAEELRKSTLGGLSDTSDAKVPTAEELLQSVEDALAGEIGLMLEEGVVARAEDVDVCMVLGANWPFYLGGITPHLDRVGASERMLGRRLSA
ncbi:3-hydroxyacyl-CoA dehydrogenase NAD-binding domain-containing protein [Kocuria sp.]|uniref:3-hydroxyacyl-CoA dehydrogenase NAD-binding domain-containing protein n=1 Tax=Kocuria sp. TaxID=1871328 RepID=UPI0026E00B07|nr:3-hydroxyacyl-CoA dehydrogenase NAD-binding domain-containing protein [Kocuria sp.]MDO5618947.1 3-hydroxyacyl-CoA dehydrogenase NAD-binding domain-containing protein [Kocuria sp.]